MRFYAASMRLVCLAAAGHCMAAAGPLVLTPTLQKFRTFYPLDGPAGPGALLQRANPLPCGNLTSLVVATDGAVWLGSRTGLVRYGAMVPEADHIQYFAGRRYLPDDHVLTLVPDDKAGVWVRTAAGVSHIELKSMTLETKAEFFEERVSKRHDRYGLVATSRLTREGDPATNQLEPSDNDGLWTGMYAAGECFRYSVTQSPEALSRARKAVEAVLFLTKVTGIPGYPARSYVRKGEPDADSSQWHDSADGKYRWKGDTSSDEIVGHLFLYGIAFDLLPDRRLKEDIASATRAILDHILAHHYNLVGETGKPTSWGKWSEAYFTKEGYSDSPLNALELLSFLKVAAHITSDPKYQREYRHLALDLGYARIATTYIERREEINYSDEELFMLPLYSIMQYEQDPALRTIYHRALEQWWQNEQREKCPLWTFIHASAVPDQKVDIQGAVWTLERTPMDLIDWPVKNSIRQDLKMDDGLDRAGLPQTKTLLPPDERPIGKWNSDPFVVDGGSGHEEDDGAFFLLPYWMGRYHKLIEESNH